MGEKNSSGKIPPTGRVPRPESGQPAATGKAISFSDVVEAVLGMPHTSESTQATSLQAVYRLLREVIDGAGDDPSSSRELSPNLASLSEVLSSFASVREFVPDRTAVFTSPTYDHAVSFAEKLLAGGRFSDAVRVARSFFSKRFFGDALLLEAAWRHRLGPKNPLLDTILPLLRWPLLLYGAISFGAVLYEQETFDKLSEATNRVLGEGHRVHVELGGAMAPYTRNQAGRYPQVHFIPADPQFGNTMSTLFGGETPQNVTALQASAAELAAFGARDPFADRVVITNPNPLLVNSLLLSAALMVMPRGHVVMFSEGGASPSMAVPKALGFDTEITYLYSPAPAELFPPIHPLAAAALVVMRKFPVGKIGSTPGGGHDVGGRGPSSAPPDWSPPGGMPTGGAPFGGASAASGGIGGIHYAGHPSLGDLHRDDLLSVPSNPFSPSSGLVASGGFVHGVPPFPPVAPAALPGVIAALPVMAPSGVPLVRK